MAVVSLYPTTINTNKIKYLSDSAKHLSRDVDLPHRKLMGVEFLSGPAQVQVHLDVDVQVTAPVCLETAIIFGLILTHVVTNGHRSTHEV